MTLGLANRCTSLYVYRVLFYLMVYHISQVYLALMYIHHRHIVYSELHRHHYQFLDKSASDNANSPPLRHEVYNVYQKMIIMGIGSCYNNFSHICVKHQHYLEHDTVYLFLFFPWIFFCILPDQWHHFCDAIFQTLLELLS